MRAVTVKVRDNTTLAAVAQIDYFTELRTVERWLGVGRWVLTAPLTAPGIAELLASPDRGLIVEDTTTKEITFSGFVDLDAAGNPTIVRTVADDNGQLVSVVQISGSCDNGWLAHRLAHPQPLTATPPWSSQEHDVRVGPGTTVLLDLIDRNAGPGAIVDRQVAGLVLAADPAQGATVTARARWQNLLVLLGEVATASGAGFQVRQRSRVLTASAFVPTDRSADIAFSLSFGNLASFEYAVTAATGTFIYAGGQGEGTARVVATASATGRRVEQFIDRRDVSDPGELASAAGVALVEGAGKTSLKFEPIDTQSCAYGQHYRLGDGVAVLVDGIRTVDTVRAVETVVAGGVMTRTITVGPEDNSGPAALFRGITTLSRRVRQLERI